MAMEERDGWTRGAAAWPLLCSDLRGPGPRHRQRGRRWHPPGTDRAEAERLAAKLAAKEQGRIDAVRSLTFGAYLTQQWLPAKKLHLATSTFRGYERNVKPHVLPVLGRVPIRRFRYQQIEAVYDALQHPSEGRGMAPKTVYAVHLIIRGSLDDAVRRGLVTRNVAVVARAPKQRSLQGTEGVSLTEEELRLLLRTAAGHRFFPILWLTAMTGMRRGEVLALKWPDIDVKKCRLALNRGLVAVGYEVHQTRGKTKTSRRSIDLDDNTITVLEGWRAFQAAEFAAVGIDNAEQPRHQRRRPREVVSERLGHANVAFTMQTYQHLFPGMQADAARTVERLTKPVPPPASDTVERRGNGRRKTV